MPADDGACVLHTRESRGRIASPSSRKTKPQSGTLVSQLGPLCHPWFQSWEGGPVMAMCPHGPSSRHAGVLTNQKESRSLGQRKIAHVHHTSNILQNVFMSENHDIKTLNEHFVKLLLSEGHWRSPSSVLSFHLDRLGHHMSLCMC